MFITRLLQLIQEQNIPKNKLLTDLNLGRNSFVNWEQRKTIPSGDIVFKISEYFGVSMEYLLGVTDIREKNVVSPHTELSPHEANIINAYRAQPEIQHAIDRFLGIKKEIGSELASEMADIINTYEKMFAKKPSNTK